MLHGLESTKHANVMQHLTFSQGVESLAPGFMLEMIDVAQVSNKDAFHMRSDTF